MLLVMNLCHFYMGDNSYSWASLNTKPEEQDSNALDVDDNKSEIRELNIMSLTI